MMTSQPDCREQAEYSGWDDPDDLMVDGETTEQYLQRFMNDCHRAAALSDEAQVEILASEAGGFFDELKRAIDQRCRAHAAAVAAASDQWWRERLEALAGELEAAADEYDDSNAEWSNGRRVGLDKAADRLRRLGEAK